MPRGLDKIYHVIRLAKHGCTNRPFYHIVLLNNNSDRQDVPLEKLGTYDPIANIHNEKLVSLNVERIKYHLANDAQMSDTVAKLFGKLKFL